MTKWMYATGRALADADKMPTVDPNFKLDRCRDTTGDYCGAQQRLAFDKIHRPVFIMIGTRLAHDEIGQNPLTTNLSA